MWPSGLTLAMTMTLNFQGQIRNLLYLNQKWSDYHETKKKHIDWTLDLKCDHCVWPWTWPWPWIFKVKYEIWYISTKSGPKVRCSDLPDCDWGDFKSRRAVDSSSYIRTEKMRFSNDMNSHCTTINLEEKCIVKSIPLWQISICCSEIWSNSVGSINIMLKTIIETITINTLD